jgi:hypothetical protein
MSQSAPTPIGGPPHDVGGPPPMDPEVLQQRIQQTRAELGQTVAALSAKTHVAARAQGKATEVVDRVRHSEVVTRVRHADVGELVQQAKQVDVRQAAGRGVEATRRRPVPVAAALAGLLAALAVAVRRRRRNGDGPRSRQARR